jgi:hypothetical protein
MSLVIPALLADGLLVLHVGIVLFVVVGELLFLAGGVRGWQWVRHRGLRTAHLGLMVFIAVQTWLGQLCPLTIWEQQLRRAAGQPTHDRSFIEYWLSELLYVEAPWWVFVAAYSAFALLVLATWHWVPPHRRHRPPRSP